MRTVQTTVDDKTIDQKEILLRGSPIALNREISIYLNFFLILSFCYMLANPRTH